MLISLSSDSSENNSAAPCHHFDWVLLSNLRGKPFITYVSWDKALKIGRFIDLPAFNAYYTSASALPHSPKGIAVRHTACHNPLTARLHGKSLALYERTSRV